MIIEMIQVRDLYAIYEYEDAEKPYFVRRVVCLALKEIGIDNSKHRYIEGLVFHKEKLTCPANEYEGFIQFVTSNLKLWPDLAYSKHELTNLNLTIEGV